MKKLLSLFAVALFSMVAAAQVSQTVAVTAPGNLATQASAFLTTVMHLTVTGDIDARDVKCMRDQMTLLTVVDLSGANIVSYTGDAGTTTGTITYPANEMPQYSFVAVNPINQMLQGKSSLQIITFPPSLTSIGQNAFTTCTNLKSLSLPAGLVSIGDQAFMGCNKLLGSLTIPGSVTTIGKKAFWGCYLITDFNVETANTTYSSINGVLFNKDQTTLINYPCAKPGGYNIPATVTSIPTNAFNGSIVTSITFPVSTVSLSSKAISSCTQLKTVSCMGETAPSVMYKIVAGLDSSSISYNPGENKPDVFVPSASAVTTYTNTAWGTIFPTQIKTGYGLSVNLSSPGTLNSLLSATEKSNMTNLTVTGTMDARDVKTIRDGMPNLATLNLAGASIVAYSGSEGTDPLSSTYPANEMPASSFYNNSNNTKLTSISLPTGLCAIGSNALRSCTGLTSMVLPAGITDIGASVFNTCSGLSDLILPVKLSSIGDNAFASCTGLKSILCRNTTPPTLGTGCFTETSAITDVYVLSTAAVTSYKANTSWYGFFPNTIIKTNSQTVACTAGNLATLASAYLNTVINLTVTGTINVLDIKTMHDNMPMLAVLDLSGVTIAAATVSFGQGTSDFTTSYPADELPQNSFGRNIGGVITGKKNLLSIKLPTGLESIGSQAFQGCTGLSVIDIPAQVTTIYSGFISDTYLVQMNVDAANTTYSSVDGVIFNKDKSILKFYPFGKQGAYTVPSTVTSIGQSAFSNCAGLTEITFPTGLTTIDISAFYQCTGLTEITLPASLTTIGYSAFSQCTNLKKVTSNSSTVPALGAGAPSFYNNCFASTYNVKDVFVPNTNYKENQYWYYTFPGDIIKTGLTTALAIQTSSKVKVFTTASEIVIDGLSNGATVELYSLNGVRIQSRKAQGDRMTINVLGHAVYLVKVDAKAFKVVL